MYKKSYTNKFSSIIFLILYIIVYINSCNFISFDYFSASCSVPDKVNYYFQDEITVSFSKPIEINSLNSIVSLKMGNQFVPLEVFPNGNNSFKIKPKANWQKGASYSFSIIGQLKQKSGASYNVSLIRDFIYGKKDAVLKLDMVACPKENFDGLKMPLVFNFNKAVNKASFIQGFTLSPNNQFNIVFSSDLKQVSIFPKDQWDINENYSWSLENITSFDGYLLNQEENGSYFTFKDSQLPLLTHICPVIEGQNGYVWLKESSLDSLSGCMPIGFIFSKPILYDSFVSSLSFYPDIKGSLRWNPNDPKEFLWVPSEQWGVDVMYQMEISTSVKDFNSLPLFQKVTKNFTPSTNYLVLEKIKLGLDQEIQNFSQDFYLCNLDYTAENNVLGIELFFSSAIPKEKREATVGAISLNSFFPVTSSNPTLSYVHWSQDGMGLYLRWIGCSASSDEREVFYRLVISNDKERITNSKGETLKEEICLLIKTL